MLFFGTIKAKTFRIPQKNFAYPLRPFDKAQDRLCDFACAFISVLLGLDSVWLGSKYNIFSLTYNNSGCAIL